MMTFDDVTARRPDQFVPSFKPECGQGWAQIVGRLLDEASDGFRIQAVSQKMGALRIEADRADEDMRPLMLAEFRSRVTCEECGKAGHMRTLDGWKRCRCDDHSTDEERAQPPRPAWTIGRLTSEGFAWYDPTADAIEIVSLAHLEQIGMPADQIERLKSAS
ncbi:hypothetical protein G8E10_24840 [Rhizobiaceae bacterium CRRU44]|uniref:Uncharacterized protein n=1 Tax=Ferranicluibacter rubi TaxID=2715133 RepID=A0AA43ZKY4_9HYPH|nr:hypothetical protein [Ferranicluibacter rubi]NHT78930.1 hypothetical protein [Ferranicluibacter rubi]